MYNRRPCSGPLGCATLLKNVELCFFIKKEALYIVKYKRANRKRGIQCILNFHGKNMASLLHKHRVKSGKYISQNINKSYSPTSGIMGDDCFLHCIYLC